jgi:hypothetical protein
MPPFLKSIRSVMPAISAVMLIVLLMSCASPDRPAPSSSAMRTEEFAKLPDWSGVWRLRGSPALLDVEDGKA